MHHIHRTKAFVLKNFPSKDADSHIVFLTEDIGLIKAIAQSGRKAESRFRQSIQDFSMLHIALVFGRSGWRLTNATFINNFFYEIEQKELKDSICKTFSLINRMIVDEMEDLDIFEIAEEFVNFAIKNQNFFIDSGSHKKDDLISAFEIILTAKILRNLGYLQTNIFGEFIEDTIDVEKIISLANLSETQKKQKLTEINRAIRDSHL